MHSIFESGGIGRRSNTAIVSLGCWPMRYCGRDNHRTESTKTAIEVDWYVTSRAVMIEASPIHKCWKILDKLCEQRVDNGAFVYMRVIVAPKVTRNPQWTSPAPS